jgi:putative zinc finger protein
MDTNGARAERRHQRVVELIPWYVNGTLETAERQTVDDHVAGCARCQAELASERELAQAVQGAEAVAPSPHPAQLARLLARIDAHEAAVNAAEEVKHNRRRLAALFEPAPHRMRQLLVAELAAILVLAVALTWHLQPAARVETAASGGKATYITLTNGEQVVVPPGTTPIDLLFKEDATAGRIHQILSRIKGQIISGPSPSAGYYVVAIPVGSGDDPVELIVAHLNAQRDVVEIATKYAGAGER